jgi:2-oxoglutarate ferredoxin oxidoreductase subunit alpha
MAFEAARIAIEHMTPVILLSDAFIGNGSSAWRVPDADEFPEIHPRFVPENLVDTWTPYMRDEKTLSRYWAIPGTKGLAHRIGGLEKDADTGAISTDPANHEKMVNLRREKVARIANDIPALEVTGNADADTLLVGWGGTYGHLLTAASELNAAGTPVAFAHFRYINPLPANTAEVFGRYRRVIVAELNSGQFADFLQAKFPNVEIHRINKVQGQPFLVSEVTDAVKSIINK